MLSDKKKSIYIILILFMLAFIIRLGLTIYTNNSSWDFADGDAGHYIQIAEQFNNGNYSLDYLKTGKAHRQFLYPLICSIFINKNSNTFIFRFINVIFGSLMIIICYLFINKQYNRGYALLVSIFSLLNVYLIAISVIILTEVLFLFLLFFILCFLVKYLQEKNNLKNIVLCSIFCGLAYLTRPNALSIFILITFVLLYFVIIKKEKIRNLFLFIFLFLIVTSPSIIARTLYCHNPFYHEYLSNFLWADSFEQAHVWNSPITAYDYFKTHNILDMIKREIQGVRFILTKEFRCNSIFNLFWMIGIFVSIIKRKNIVLTVLFLSLFFAYAWMAKGISFNTIRIFYYPLYPFMLIYFVESIIFLKEDLFKKFSERWIIIKKNEILILKAFTYTFIFLFATELISELSKIMSMGMIKWYRF